VELSLAFSPCPNDAYIFAAWAQGLLPDAPPVRVVVDDAETLNLAALEERYAVTKVSYGAVPALLNRYRVLRAGGALGRGCGPLVVAKPDRDGVAPTLTQLGHDARFAIPGTMTTAHLLLRLALGDEIDASPMRFERIVDAVAAGDYDAGLLIHESRFSYEKAGLACVADLGAWWESTTKHPIPLGAIVAHRDLDSETIRQIEAGIRASLRFAREHEKTIMPYVREHAHESDEAVIRAHINLYVNDHTVDVGEDGIAAVRELFDRAARAGLLSERVPVGQGTRP
jgi:1,4-dihydroxy-6-naphthoate synthase